VPPPAQYLRAQGYGADADYVEAGQSDDSREVQIALAMHKILHVAPTPPTKFGAPPGGRGMLNMLARAAASPGVFPDWPRRQNFPMAYCMEKSSNPPFL
jgi:hypothetical protein